MQCVRMFQPNSSEPHLPVYPYMLAFRITNKVPSIIFVCVVAIDLWHVITGACHWLVLFITFLQKKDSSRLKLDVTNHKRTSLVLVT